MIDRILIVGGAGHIGGAVVDEMMELGNVVVYDNLTYEDRYFKKGVEFIYGDVRDRVKMKGELQKLGPKDVVIWLAAIVGDGACAVDPQMTREVNVDAVKFLVDNFKGKIVFPSTCSVYGENDDLLDELAPTNPLSLYAETKLEAEQYILKNASWPVVFRLGTLYGISDLLSRPRLDLVVNIFSAAAASGKTLNVTGGDQWRPLLHVKDVASAIRWAVTAGQWGLFNLTGENYTILQVAQEINRIEPCNIVLTDLAPSDKRNYKVSSKKILELGWAPSPIRDLKAGIKEVVKLVAEKRIVDIGKPSYHNQKFQAELKEKKEEKTP